MKQFSYSSKKLLTTKKQKGFTLLELLVVMVIVGLLSAIGLGGFMSSQKKGRDTRRKADLQAIQSGLELYYNDFNEYPESGAGNTIDGCDGATCAWNSIWQKNGSIYMVQLPSDPGGNTYFYSSTGVGYQLYARLENTEDIAAAQCPAGLGFYVGTDCGSTACNFVVASSNTDPDVLPSIECD